MYMELTINVTRILHRNVNVIGSCNGNWNPQNQRMLIMPRMTYIIAIMSNMPHNDNINSEHNWFIRIIGDQKRQTNDH